MLKSTYVKVNFSNRNRGYFESLGYSAIDGLFIIKVEDLMPKSPALVEVECDYCTESKTIKYADYIKTKNEHVDKYACSKCAKFKREEILDFRIENNLISENEIRGFYKNEIFVLDKLKEFIEKYGFVGMSSEDDIGWRKIRRGLKNLDISIDTACSKLGYDIKVLQLRVPNGYYDDFENVRCEIQEFIDCYGRFPSQTDLTKEVGMHSAYSKHGTLDEIKVKMDYVDENDLVDLSGYINKSRYELITANFLILNGIPYKRERFPFKKINKELKYKSDFCFYLKSGKEIHCEVWGGKRKYKEGYCGKYADYNDIMSEKIKLYNEHEVELISIDPSIFNLSVKGIKENLYNIFSSYFEMDFNKVENSLLSTKKLKDLSDDELLEEIMQYSTDGEHLPTSSHLRKLGHEYLFLEAVNRYDHYVDFADKYGLKTKRKNNNYWSVELIFEKFDYMFEKYGKILSSDEMKKYNSEDYNIKNIYDRIVAYGGLTTLKLKYLVEKLMNNSSIGFTNDEINHFIFKVINDKLPSKTTQEQMYLAQEIKLLLNR